MTCIRDTLHWGLLFGAQDALKAFFNYTHQHPEAPINQLPLNYVNNTLGFGLISGLVTGFFTNPFANVANRQRTVGLPVNEARKAIVKQYGYRGLFCNGLFFCVPRVIAQATIVKGVSDYLEKPKRDRC